MKDIRVRLGLLTALGLMLLNFTPTQAAPPTRWYVNGNGYVGLLNYQVNPNNLSVSGTLLGTPCQGFMVGRRLVLHRKPRGTQIWEGWIMEPNMGAPGQSYYRGGYFFAGTISEGKANNSLYPWYGVPATGAPPWNTGGGGSTGGGGGGGAVINGRGVWVSSLHRRTYQGQNLPFDYRVVLRNPVPNMVRVNLPNTNWGCANCEKFFSTIVQGRPTAFAFKYASDNTAMLYVNGRPVFNQNFFKKDYCTGAPCCGSCCDSPTNCSRVVTSQRWIPLGQNAIAANFNPGRNVITWRVRQDTGGSGFHCLLQVAGARVSQPPVSGGGGGGTPGGGGGGGHNLLANPSFEQGGPVGRFRKLNRGSTDLPGWSVGGHSIDVVGTYWKNSHGHKSVDLNGSGPGSISQTFRTLPGKDYQVVFDLSANPECGNTTKTVQVDIVGVVRKTFTSTPSGRNFANMQWTRKSFVFAARGTSSTIHFTAVTGPGSEGCGPTLDNTGVYELHK